MEKLAPLVNRMAFRTAEAPFKQANIAKSLCKCTRISIWQLGSTQSICWLTRGSRKNANVIWVATQKLWLHNTFTISHQANVRYAKYIIYLCSFKYFLIFTNWAKLKVKIT